MRLTCVALVFLLSGCAVELFANTRAPGITPREEGKRILGVGALELVGGAALTFGGYYAYEHAGASTSTMIPGTEGQGLSGDGLYDHGSGGYGGVLAMLVGGPTAASGVVDVAHGLYEVITNRFVGGGAPRARRRPRHPPSCVEADMDDRPCRSPE